jgi:hypothetical protein
MDSIDKLKFKLDENNYDKIFVRFTNKRNITTENEFIFSGPPNKKIDGIECDAQYYQGHSEGKGCNITGFFKLVDLSNDNLIDYFHTWYYGIKYILHEHEIEGQRKKNKKKIKNVDTLGNMKIIILDISQVYDNTKFIETDLFNYIPENDNGNHIYYTDMYKHGFKLKSDDFLAEKTDAKQEYIFNNGEYTFVTKTDIKIPISIFTWEGLKILHNDIKMINYWKTNSPMFIKTAKKAPKDISEDNSMEIQEKSLKRKLENDYYKKYMKYKTKYLELKKKL